MISCIRNHRAFHPQTVIAANRRASSCRKRCTPARAHTCTNTLYRHGCCATCQIGDSKVCRLEHEACEDRQASVDAAMRVSTRSPAVNAPGQCSMVGMSCRSSMVSSKGIHP